MALATCLLRPAAPRAAASSCRLGNVLAAPQGSWRWGRQPGWRRRRSRRCRHWQPEQQQQQSSSPASRASVAVSAAVHDGLAKGVVAENTGDVARIVETPTVLSLSLFSAGTMARLACLQGAGLFLTGADATNARLWGVLLISAHGQQAAPCLLQLSSLHACSL